MRNWQKSGSLKRTGRGVTGRKGRALRISEGRHRRGYAEEALHESEKRFRHIAERSYDAITVIDSEGRFTYISPSMERIFGYRPEELVGVQFRSFVPESEMLQVASAFNRMMKGENVEGLQLEVKRKDGSLVHIEVNGSPVLKDGQVLGMQGIIRDITDRKHAEAALHESEAKYRTLVEQSLQGILIAQGPPPRLVFANPAMAKILGYARDELTSLSPKETEGLVHPEDRAVFFGRFADRLQGKPAPPRYEIRGIRKDGETRWLDFSPNRIEYKGQPAVQATFVDITERKRVENASRQQYSTLEGIINSSDAPIFSVDRQYRYTSFNNAHASVMKAIYGKDIEIGKSLLDYMTVAEDREEAKRNLDRALAGEHLVKEAYSGEEARSRLYFEVSHSPIMAKDGGIIGAAVFVRDLTERKRADEALRESEEKLKAVVYGSPIPQFVIDRNHTVIYWNNALQEITGIKAEEVVGTKEHWRAFYSEERPCMADLLVDGRIEQIPEWYRGKYSESTLVDDAYEATDYFSRGKEGKWLYFTAAAIKDPEGNVIGAVETLEDITERKRVEEALGESEERFRGLVEGTAAGVGVIDLTGHLTYVNKAFAGLMGYSDHELVGRSFLDFIQPEDRDKLSKLFLTAAASAREAPDMEFRAIRKDGSLRYLWTRPTRLKVRGETVGFEAIVMDITYRKRIEEALQRSEEKYRGLVENINDVVFSVDVTGLLTYIGPVVERTTGYKADELTGQPFSRFIHPDDLASVQRRFAGVLAGELEPFEFRILDKDGGVLYVRTSSRPLMEAGKLVGMTGVIIDITERKRVEEELSQSVERYQSLFNRTLDGIYRSTHAGRFVDVNPAFVRMFGYANKQEMLDIADIKKELYFSPEERGSHLLDTGQEEVDVYRMRRKDGSEIWVEDHGHDVHDEQGNVMYHEGISRDVTERRRMQAELEKYTKHLEELVDERTRRLREGEEQLRAILNATTATVMVLDREGKIIEANDAFCKLWNLSYDEVIGRNAFSLIKDSEVRERRKTWIDEVFRTGQYVRAEDEHRDRWNDSIMYPVRGSDGSVVAVAMYALNITEHKRMEEELRSTKERLEYVVTSNPAAIYSGKPLPDMSDWDLTYLSENVADILGYEASEFVGHPEFWKLIVHPKDRPSVLAEIPRLWEKGRNIIEYRMCHKDGDYRWIREEANAVRDASGKPIEVNGYWIDITERKRMEEEIESLARLPAENPDPVLRLDRHGTVVLANEASNAILQDWGTRIGGVAPKPWRDLTTDALSTGLIRSVDVESDGKSYTFLLKPIVEAGYVNLYGRDITELKHTQEALLKSQRLAAIGQTAAMVGHDLRNPLQGMTGILYLAKKLSRSERVEERKEAAELLDTLDDQILYMDKIVSDLQSYAGPVETEPVETNLPNLVSEAISNAHVPGNVETHVTVPEDLTSVMVDRTLLQRVLANLIMNAVQAMPKGGNVTVATHKEQESLTMTVEDTGEGIARENIDKIFNPFFTTKAKGQGLGLAVCKRLVEAQNGTITVRSEVGKGSTFTVTIPTKRSSAPV